MDCRVKGLLRSVDCRVEGLLWTVGWRDYCGV